MNKQLLLILTFALCSVLIYSQEVKTLVQGPSTFNDGLAVDNQGNIYAANYYGSEITQITLDGNTSIFAGGFNSPNGIAFGPDGYLYVPSALGDRVDKVSPTGEVTNVVSNINNPTGIAFDQDGNMLISQYQDSKISIYRTNGTLAAFSTDNKLNGPVGLVFDEEYNLYIGNFTDGKILKRTLDGTITEIADVSGWLGFIAYSDGHIYATAFERNKIYRVATDGTNFMSYAGTGSGGQANGNLSTATFDEPNGITSSVTGDTLYVSDYGTRSLRMIVGILGLTDVEEEAELPNKFNLEQNYPNPFNPTTSIEYSVSSSEHVTLKVYDILGKEIATLVNEQKQNGKYEVKFDAVNLPSGVYIYQLNSDSFNKVKKMILQK